MDDPYQILGVARTATEAEIRTAYRKLAKQHHPDLNPDNTAAAERFKTIGSAYGLLSDPEKRARFDRGEIDASGAENPPERGFYRDFSEDAARSKYRPDMGEGTFNPDDLESVFAQAFRARGGGGFREGGFGGGFSARGPDARYALTVSFQDAANGAVRRLTLPDGGTLDVTLPAGVDGGQILRLKGKGSPGLGEGPAGDALIEITVAPDPVFRRDGNDILVDLPVSLREAVLGAKVPVPTLKGPVTLTVPPHSTTGTRLRLRERGIAGGHQYVELRVVLSGEDEPELAAFLKDWTPRNPFDPRAGGGK